MPGIETGRINYLTTGFHKFGSIIYFEVVAISNEKRRLLNCPTLREKCPNTEFFSVPYFLAFGLNTEIYSVSLCISPECGKIRTRKNSALEHFSRSTKFHKCRSQLLGSQTDNLFSNDKFNRKTCQIQSYWTKKSIQCVTLF